jgi:hypothetical protein
MRASCNIAFAAVLVVACVGVCGAASAHHSFAMFDQKKSVTLQGAVRDFIWSNPHVFIQLVASDAKGKQVEWSIEMSSPEHLSRVGWKHGTLKPGDKVTILIHPTRDGGKGGQYLAGKGPSGLLPGSPPVQTAS